MGTMADSGKRSLPVAVIAFWLVAGAVGASAPAQEKAAVTTDGVDYLRDVKPIFRTHCLRCHGPLKSEAGLRLDTKPLALKGGENGAALAPGQPAASLLWKRVSAGKELRMPPEAAGLSRVEIETLRRWIAAGAVSPEGETPRDPRDHWSYRPVKRPVVPKVGDAQWSQNPVDAFIFRRHQQGQVTPQAVAPRHVLLRRVSLDLIGLPPSSEQLQRFLADESPDAYARAVDRLLASAHYGERWGRHWLDVWRYSDWYGFQKEVRFSQKNIWHWRDWVVESLNADKGYQRMAREMLAGDEIVPFDPENLRATGFLVRNRNTDSREQWIRDTVEHTAKAFLAMTMACVQCHDHPYDPIGQDEYYRYRNIFEPVQVGIDGGGGGPGGLDLAGVARIFDRDRNAATRFYIRGNDKTPDKIRKITPGIPRVIGGWVEPRQVSLPPRARIPHLRKPVAEQTLARLNDNVRRAETAMATAEALMVDFARRLEKPAAAPAKPGGGNLIRDTFTPKRDPRWHTGDGEWAEAPGGGLLQSDVGEEAEGWIEFLPPGGSPREFTLHLVLKLTGDGVARQAGISFDRHEPGGHAEGVFLSAAKNKSGLGFFSESKGERRYADPLFRAFDVPPGREFVIRIHVRDRLINVYVNDVLLQAHRLANRTPGGIRLWTRDASAEFALLQLDRLPGNLAMAPADSIKQFSPSAVLDPADASHRVFFEAIREQAKLKRALQRQELAAHQATWTADAFRLFQAPPREDKQAVATHKKKLEPLAIVAQMAQRRLDVAKAREAKFVADQALVMARSQKRQGPLPGDVGQTIVEQQAKAVVEAEKKVESTAKQLATAVATVEKPSTARYRGLPGSYGSSSGRRLSLAHWVASTKNPLTARVAVNHIWLRHFEQALVTSVFDFGLNGQKPSHPRLLDWLAAELMRPSVVRLVRDGRVAWAAGKPQVKSWSMKHLHRVIVTSRTYRTASTPHENNLTIDPDNRLLWRMPARRMDAETVRDSILSVSGGLDTTLGGPDIPSAEGLSVLRRSLYFHQSPEDQMAFLKLFDAADPAECYQRHRSIVPHQALALFNSEISLVHSRRLARRLSRQFTETTAFIPAAFRRVLSRDVSTAERVICAEFLARREAAYRQAGTVKPSPELVKTAAAPSIDPRVHARENLVHSLFNHHDFVTIK